MIEVCLGSCAVGHPLLMRFCLSVCLSFFCLFFLFLSEMTHRDVCVVCLFVCCWVLWFRCACLGGSMCCVVLVQAMCGRVCVRGCRFFSLFFPENNAVCRFKTPPCAHSRRSHVYRHHVHMYKHPFFSVCHTPTHTNTHHHTPTRTPHTTRHTPTHNKTHTHETHVTSNTPQAHPNGQWSWECSEQEHQCCNPKGGELCLTRAHFRGGSERYWHANRSLDSDQIVSLGAAGDEQFYQVRQPTPKTSKWARSSAYFGEHLTTPHVALNCLNNCPPSEN